VAELEHAKDDYLRATRGSSFDRHRLEELSTPGLDALDRERTVVILSVSPLETHGPHLPLGVDAFTARHFAEAIAERVVASRPGFTVVLAPTLYLGSFTFDTVGTVRVRQRVVRDVVVDYGARSPAPASATSWSRTATAAPAIWWPSRGRRDRVTPAPGHHGSFTGHLAWEFLRGRLLPQIEAGLGRRLSPAEREAFSETPTAAGGRPP